MEELIRKSSEVLSGTAAYVVAAAVALVVLYLAWKVLAGRKRRAPAPPDLRIDIAALGSEGPPAGGPGLEFYGVTVRLAAIVLAPAGRVRELPALDKLDEAFEALVPGLAAVVAAQRPLVRKWPPQLSSRGFALAFFAQARLPGEAGKGTPWSSAAGVLKIEGQPVMAGLVLRAGSANSHGQEIVESEEQWLRILRVTGM